MWNEENHKAFEDLKKYIIEPPLLSKPNQGKLLFLYLSVFDKALSVIPMKEEGKVQKLIYYVSKVLHEAQPNYSTVEKFVLAMIMTSRKLRPYFQAHI